MNLLFIDSSMKYDDLIEMIDVHDIIVYHNLIMIYLNFKLDKLIVMKQIRKVSRWLRKLID